MSLHQDGAGYGRSFARVLVCPKTWNRSGGTCSRIEHAKLISDAASVSLAIYFHDVIYDPRAGSPQNEIDSANVFDDFAQEALPAHGDLGQERGFRAMKVRRWIVVSSAICTSLRFCVGTFHTTPTAKVQTAHHMCTEDDEMDCKLFMDFDMAVLGRPWPQYEMYSGLSAG
eukprot:Skav217001  [mRNA]  locus=scaffold1803:53632:55638:+ [translate_table: standard]